MNSLGMKRFSTMLLSLEFIFKSICSLCPPRSGQSLETTSNTNSERVLLHTSDSQSVPLARMKCVAASSSSSAWLYPDGSTSHLSVAQKWDAKPGGTSGCQLMSVLLDENFAVSKPGVFQQRNTLAHPVDPNPFRFKSVHPVGGHCLTNLPSHSSVSLSTDTGGSPLSLDQVKSLFLVRASSSINCIFQASK